MTFSSAWSCSPFLVLIFKNWLFTHCSLCPECPFSLFFFLANCLSSLKEIYLVITFSLKPSSPPPLFFQNICTYLYQHLARCTKINYGDCEFLKEVLLTLESLVLTQYIYPSIYLLIQSFIKKHFSRAYYTPAVFRVPKLSSEQHKQDPLFVLWKLLFEWDEA